MSTPSSEQIAERWSAHAECYHRSGDLANGHPTYRLAWVDALAELVGYPRRDGSPPLRIADVGTGTGEIALLLAGMGHDVTGYDIAPGMLALARAKEQGSGLALRIAPGNAYNLPLDDGSVNVVINRMVLWTLHDPLRALAEWRRVLVPGGKIVVIDALHYATPRTVGEQARKIRERVYWSIERVFWSTLGRLRQFRHHSTDDRGGSRGRYRTDAVRPPGMSWQDLADAQRHFIEAGMNDVTSGWLSTVAEVGRRTAPLRWRIAGLLPSFFTLVWQKPL